MTYTDQMKNRIAESDYGTAFVVSDFIDVMEYETAKKSLARCEKDGIVRRVIRGVYDKPGYSMILQEESAPNPEEIAKAIARNFNWTIAPDENTALNLLGLSTQVPAKWSFISSGPYRNYEVGNVSIGFMHRACKEISGMSYMSALVIEALKGIGKDRLNESHITHLQERVSEEHKKILLKEAKSTTTWIYSAIKEICKEEVSINV